MEDYLSKVNNTLSLNPDFPESIIKGNYSTGTLSTKQLIKEATKRAEEIEGFDWIVWNFRQSKRDEPDPEYLPLGMFENEYTESIDPDFAIELVETRNEALPDDWDGPEGDCPRELPHHIRSNVGGTA